MHRLLAVLLFVLLAACGQQQQSGQASREDYPVVNAPEINTDIGPNGAGPITSALAMNVETVRAAAPSFIVAETQDQVEGEAFTAITLSAADEVVFRILPTADRAHIHAIVTRSTQARGPAQEIVGQTKFADVPEDEAAVCLSETVDGGPGFACSTAPDGSFWRVYRLPAEYDGPSDPFDAIDPDVLHEATLAEMRWIAPRA
ncbi:MAG: hypothetical protein JNJ63_12910 [Hyphomonadaceae bacterium]|nr:hypothetical protein [Hyphomonadaceae bacterium]